MPEHSGWFSTIVVNRGTPCPCASRLMGRYPVWCRKSGVIEEAVAFNSSLISMPILTTQPHTSQHPLCNKQQTTNLFASTWPGSDHHEMDAHVHTDHRGYTLGAECKRIEENPPAIATWLPLPAVFPMEVVALLLAHHCQPTALVGWVARLEVIGISFDWSTKPIWGTKQDLMPCPSLIPKLPKDVGASIPPSTCRSTDHCKITADSFTEDISLICQLPNEEETHLHLPWAYHPVSAFH
ncbi:hypothetical protein Pelo_18548 [Pelomyxa schiedti]|nr:hypothetical protein Pelo_18548 [Pelomyxa schiedti]